jgi:hypothetical protein
VYEGTEVRLCPWAAWLVVVRVEGQRTLR